MTSKPQEVVGTLLGVAFMLLVVAWLANVATGYAAAWALAVTIRVATH